MRIIFCRGTNCERECAPPPPPPEPEIPNSSPARLLAASLTDPETRDEWGREYKSGMGTGCGYVEYLNSTRDLRITKHYAGFGNGYSVETPFTLTRAEQKIVLDALHQFELRKVAKREADALSRLTAPKSKRK
jgi:hypothetical protein